MSSLILYYQYIKILIISRNQVNFTKYKINIFCIVDCKLNNKISENSSKMDNDEKNI